MPMHAYAYPCTCMHMHGYAYICISMDMHAYAYPWICMLMHAYAYPCKCMHIHVYAYMCMPMQYPWEPYVLQTPCDSMCCTAPGKQCLAAPLGTMSCITPGKQCLAAPLGTNVLHHPWETMSYICPGELCVVNFGPRLLGPTRWFRALVRWFVPPLWVDMAHGPLGQYVLHHPWETLSCIAPGKHCVA